MTVWGRWAGRDAGERTRREVLADRTGASLRGAFGWADGGSVADGRRQAGSGIARSRARGATELGFPRPALWQMQGEAACRAGEPSGQGEEPSPKGLGGRDLLAQTDPRRPAGQVVGHHLYRQPSAVGGEAAGRHVVQTDAVLEVSNGVLDLGVAAVVGLQFQGLSRPGR